MRLPWFALPRMQAKGQEEPASGRTLKPCPFCGSQPYTRTWEGGGFQFWTITCRTCGTEKGAMNPQTAMERWNTRKGEPLT